MRYSANDKSLKKKLINFEYKIVSLYEKKKIRGPIHLSGNNERQLINIFKISNFNKTYKKMYTIILSMITLIIKKSLWLFKTDRFKPPFYIFTTPHNHWENVYHTLPQYS